MPGLSAAHIEQLFAHETDLTPYEEMEERDLYLALMRSAFQHQGKAAEDKNIMAPFYGVYTVALRGTETTTDDVVSASNGDGREFRVETAVIDGARAGIHWPWGPTAYITLSTIEDSKIFSLGVDARQEHQELFLSAGAAIKNPLTGKKVRKCKLVQSAWAGNVSGTEDFEDAKRVFKPRVFRELTPREKRLIGVAIEGVGQLAVTAA